MTQRKQTINWAKIGKYCLWALLVLAGLLIWSARILFWVSILTIGTIWFLIALSTAEYTGYRPSLRLKTKFPKMSRMPNFGMDSVASDITDLFEEEVPEPQKPQQPHIPKPDDTIELDIRKRVIKKLRENPTAQLQTLLTEEEFEELMIMIFEALE
jgi:hypothetical protein